jgi:hypothetical protein
MSNSWRQGDLISPSDAVELRLLSAAEAGSHRVVIVSHSCDIAKREELEPSVEAMIAKVVPEAKGNCMNGHSIRTLHLPAVKDDSTEWLELDISGRKEIPKSELSGLECWAERAIPEVKRGIFRRWLAQRYSRSGFPNAFISWMSERDGCGVSAKFEKAGKGFTAFLSAIYFDLHDDDTDRTDSCDPYELSIVLVYDSSDADNVLKAKEAAARVVNLFEEKCLGSDGQWKWIELVDCDAVSDRAFSLQMANTLQRWRFEHRSIAGEPLDQSDL